MKSYIIIGIHKTWKIGKREAMGCNYVANEMKFWILFHLLLHPKRTRVLKKDLNIHAIMQKITHLREA